MDACVESVSDGTEAHITNWNFDGDPSSLTAAIHSMWENFVTASQGHTEVCDFASLRKNIRNIKDRSSPQELSSFRTQYSMGFTSGHCLPGDIVATLDGVSRPLLLRMVDTGSYRLVGICVLWATKKFADPEQVSPSQAWISDVVAADNVEAFIQYVEVVVY